MSNVKILGNAIIKIKNSFYSIIITIIIRLHNKTCLRMDKNFTSENLVQLLYNETSVKEAQEIKDAMRSNENLREEYHELRDAYMALPKATFSPSKSTIQNILRYSEQSTVLV